MKDYSKYYKKLSKKYHMKNKSSKEINPLLFIILIYIVTVVNTFISLYRLNDMDIDKMHLFLNVPYFLIIIFLIVIYLFLLYKKNLLNKKKIILIVITALISLFVVPYVFSNPIAIFIIVGIVVLIGLAKIPSSSNKTKNKIYSTNSEPIVLKYKEGTEIFKKGIMIYKRNTTGEDAICSISAFEHGDVQIIVGNKKAEL